MSIPADQRTSERLGDFEIVRELGRGGMGIVYEARQVSLNRRVALKVLSGLGLSPRAVPRFRREAEAAAKLHHTNIVPVYATGEDAGSHFYAMELIEGPSLDAVVREMREQAPSTALPAVAPGLTATTAYTPPDPLANRSDVSSAAGSSVDRFDRIAAMIADVADALHHAHQNGVVHRDIKPSNLLLASDGRLSITDFGLARMLEEPGMTMTGEFVGTPAYMSPEQITAGRIPVDHRTDVYSLGATLYELLTLRPPFTAEGRDRLLAMVIQKEPAAPRSVNQKVPHDLETICLKCLEKDPDRRYASAKELADDLRRYVSRFAILAKRSGPLGRLRKWVRRNPAPSAVGVVVLLAAGAVGFFAWQAQKSEQDRIAAQAKSDEEARLDKCHAAMEKAMVHAYSGNFAEARDAVREAERLGAVQSDVRTLSGFILYQQSDFPEAKRELAQALELKPDSVAARALIATVAGEEADNLTHLSALKALKDAVPATYEDKIFLALASQRYAEERALRLLDEAEKERPSRIIDVFRLEIALDSVWRSKAQPPETVAKSLEAAESAYHTLGKNLHGATLMLHALLQAEVSYNEAGLKDKALESAARADVFAKLLLEKWPHDPLALRWLHIHANTRDGTSGTAERTRALIPVFEAARRASPANLYNPIISRYLAMSLYHTGRDRDCRTLLDSLQGDWLKTDERILILYLLLDLDEKGPEEAVAGWKRRVDTKDKVTQVRLYWLAPWLLFCGPPGQAEAKQAVPLIRSVETNLTELLPKADLGLLLRILDGAEYEVTENFWPLLAAADGCRKLGEGQREPARRRFENIYRATRINIQIGAWAQILLFRMKDPAWPRGLTGAKK